MLDLVSDVSFCRHLWSYSCVMNVVIIVLIVSFCFRSSPKSVPSLPSFTHQMSQAVQFTRPQASLPPIVCRQTFAGAVQRSPSPNTRRRSLTLQGNGNAPARQQIRPPVSRIARTPSTPASFCTLQPSSASPVLKVMPGYCSLSLQWWLLEVCGYTHTRGFTWPDPYPWVQFGAGS